MGQGIVEPVVPVYVFDEHNEAFYYWHKAKYEGYINEPLDLFHVDAHSDMGMSGRLDKSVFFSDTEGDSYLAYYRKLARDELDLGGFIMPAVLNMIIKNVYFIYPKWRKFKPLRKKINICSVFGEGRILKHDLKVDKNTDKKVFKAYPDLRYFNFSMLEAHKIPKNRKVILDIDLDYFACRDTILNNLSYELEITEEQFLNKDVFALENKTLRYSRLRFDFFIKNNKYYTTISHIKQKDAAYLPTREEIKSEIDNLIVTFRDKKIRPAVITICRSCISGYCPSDYYEFIETNLREKLQMLLEQ
jgi:hypothetical protein